MNIQNEENNNQDQLNKIQGNWRESEIEDHDELSYMINKSEQSTMFFMHNDSIYNNAIFDFGRSSSLVQN